MSPALMARPDDHVVLGVEWSEMNIGAAPAGGGPPVLVAGHTGGRLTLTFPPQHLAEETTPAGAAATVPRRSRLSGPSVLELIVPSGTRIALSIEGLLAAAESLDVGTASVVEIPWRLRCRPQPGVDRQRLVVSHTSHIASSGATNGLWRTRVSSAGGTGESNRLGMVGVDGAAAAVGDPFPVPLERDSREGIAARATIDAPALAERLELSALGGALAVSGRWETLEWDHEAVLGRDMWVRTLDKGFLYPLGHRAVFERVAVREVDPAGNVAVLRSTEKLTVVEPVRPPSTHAPTSRLFPFEEVEITRLVYTDVGDVQWHDFVVLPGLPGPVGTFFRPGVLFPVTCHAAQGPVHVEIPLLFVKDFSPLHDSAADPRLAARLREVYDSVRVPISPTRIDLVRSQDGRDGDTHQVRALTIRGSAMSSDPRPEVDRLEITLPALSGLLGDSAYRDFKYTDDYRDNGESANAFLRMIDPDGLRVSFVGQSERSGALAALSYTANAISRDHGPINVQTGPTTEPVSLASLLESDATLLGYPLRSLVKTVDSPPPPILTAGLDPGHAPAIRMSWAGVPLKSDLDKGFAARANSKLTLEATLSDSEATTVGIVTDFSMRFPPTNPLVELSFKEVRFERRTSTTEARSRPPELRIDGLSVNFLGELKLLEDLGSKVPLLNAGPQVEATSSGVSVTYALPVPSAAAGVFVMRNILFRVGAQVPFTAASPEITLRFASRTNPFVVTVMAFGGGGYVEATVGPEGLRRLDAALEFGALVAVNFFIARGEAHVLGGVRVVIESGRAELTGYLRIGGSLSILGLVSVSVELRLELTYESDTNALVGRASVIIEIDILFWSESVELDSGEWRLIGGRPLPGPTRAEYVTALEEDGAEYFEVASMNRFDAGFENWVGYRSRFVGVDW